MSEGEGGHGEDEGAKHRGKCPSHAVLNSTFSSVKCSIQKHFKMPHTKCSQSSKFIPLLSLIFLKVQTARFSLPRRQRSLSQFTLYPFSIFSPQFTLQKISPLEPGETQRVLQRAECSEERLVLKQKLCTTAFPFKVIFFFPFLQSKWKGTEGFLSLRCA